MRLLITFAQYSALNERGLASQPASQPASKRLLIIETIVAEFNVSEWKMFVYSTSIAAKTELVIAGALAHFYAFTCTHSTLLLFTEN